MEYINIFALGKKLYDNKEQVKSTLGVTSSKKPVLGSPAGTAGGAAIVVGLLALMIFMLGTYIWSIVALMKFARTMPLAAALVSLAFLFFGMPFFSLITTYAFKA
jgi:hypothetical protein